MQKSNRANGIGKLLKQKQVPFLGEFLESFFTALPMVSLFSYISTTIILYETVKKYILNVFPWMNIGWFIVVLGLIFVPLLVFVFKYVLPSVWHFRSTQMSHLEKKIDTLTEKVDALSRRADENSNHK